MTEETESLVLEILKRMQLTLGRLEDGMSDLAGEIRGLKSHMAGFMQSEFRQDTDIAAIKRRLDRIERRLDLRD